MIEFCYTPWYDIQLMVFVELRLLVGNVCDSTLVDDDGIGILVDGGD